MSGVVTDKQSRRPIEGARVTIVGNKAKSDTTTDIEGLFIVDFVKGVEEGSRVLIRVEKSGYEAYNKWVAVSSTITLQISLLSNRPVPSAHIPPVPMAKTDSFSTLVPLHGEWKNSPIPMNTNLSDPHQEFYDGLVTLASRPDKPPKGWPAYKERKFESVDEQFTFVTRLIQFYVFRSIYFLQRGVAGGLKWTAGVGVTPISKKPIVPPDAAPYPTTVILDTLSGVEFVNPVDEMLWKGRPLTMPVGTRLSFVEHANPEKGEVFTCTVRLERPAYFKVDFEVQAGPGMNNQLPAGFSTQAVQGTTTYSINISMKYEIQRRKDHGFQPDQYAAWADSLFDGLRKQMGFEAAEQVSQPPPLEKKPQNLLLPDVTLRFVYPKDPALVIANPSDSIARDIKWMVALWNMDLPDRNDPLPIPVSTFDWIRPHDEGGPQNLFDSPLVAPLLRQGNRLFGSASVSCPECARGRTYIVYIVWGEGGWVSEVENENSGKIIVPNNFLRETREAYFKQLEAAIPEKSRIQVGERNTPGVH
jgi:hypothetical protein